MVHVAREISCLKTPKCRLHTVLTKKLSGDADFSQAPRTFALFSSPWASVKAHPAELCDLWARWPFGPVGVGGFVVVVSREGRGRSAKDSYD